MKFIQAAILMCIFCFWGCSNPGKIESNTNTLNHQDSIKQFIYDYVEEIFNKLDFSKAEKYRSSDFHGAFTPELEHGPFV